MTEGLAPLPDSSARYQVMARSFTYAEDEFFSAYRSLSARKPYHALFESGQRGKYSIAAFTPFAIISGKNREVSIQTKEDCMYINGDPLEVMEGWLAPFRIERNAKFPDFQGGVLGFISYDYARYIEVIPEAADDDLETYDIYFLAFQEVYVYDHEENKLWILLHHEEGEEERAAARISCAKELWENPPLFSWGEHEAEKTKEVDPTYTHSSFSEEGFREAVNKVKEYIRSGDTFQVNISVRQDKPLKTPPLHIYEKLRELNPSPYMGYFHTPHFQLVCGSPELLIKKRDREASVRPIAGTRPRSNVREKDLAYEKELLATEKERAEHAMLVDLERNDLGKVCSYGTVTVDELMVIEKYSHVMHIVSNVKGKLAENVKVYDMIKAAFPGGTITGAPKIRTMEIIEELEPIRRGVYTGSIGWIGFDGDMELNIVIRTLIAKDGIAHVQAGAGIVIDSSPEAEYQESLKKARALWKAKEMSEEEMLSQRRAEEEVK